MVGGGWVKSYLRTRIARLVPSMRRLTHLSLVFSSLLSLLSLLLSSLPSSPQLSSTLSLSSPLSSLLSSSSQFFQYLSLFSTKLVLARPSHVPRRWASVSHPFHILSLFICPITMTLITDHWFSKLSLCPECQGTWTMAFLLFGYTCVQREIKWACTCVKMSGWSTVCHVVVCVLCLVSCVLYFFGQQVQGCQC